MEKALTAEDVAELRRPFHVNAVKWLPIGGITTNGAQKFMAHIDASLVIERLSDVDPCWEATSRPMIDNTQTDAADPFGVKHMLPWLCVLTVKGVTRDSRGQLEPEGSYNNPQPPRVDGKYIKSAESDALKRAAHRFGVGAYLRALPDVYVPEVGAGGKLWWATGKDDKRKVKGLNPAGKKYLREQYLQVVSHQQFAEHYGAMIDYGDRADDVEDVAVPPEPEDTVEQLANPQLDVLVLLSKHTGRDTTEDHVREAMSTSSTPFPRLVMQTLNSVAVTLSMSAIDKDRVRDAAMSAAESGDTTDLAELIAALAAAKQTEAGDESERSEAEQVATVAAAENGKPASGGAGGLF